MATLGQCSVPVEVTNGLPEVQLDYASWTSYGGPGDDFVRVVDVVEGQATGTPIVVRRVYAPAPVGRLVIPLWLGDTEYIRTP